MNLRQPARGIGQSKAASRISAALVLLTVAIAGYCQTATADALPEYALLQLQYKQGMQRIAPAFNKYYGKYLGSGMGTVTGKVKGSVVWDLYEEQSDPNLHRTQFVGHITSSDGSTVSFETAGYFTPRSGDDHYWDLTSAVYFMDARGTAYQELAGRLGLWQGHVDIRTGLNGETTFSHTYGLYLLTSPN
jgi:hypothetical protein